MPDEKFLELFRLAEKENYKNRKISQYNQTATLSHLIPYENKYLLALVGYTLNIIRKMKNA